MDLQSFERPPILLASVRRDGILRQVARQKFIFVSVFLTVSMVGAALLAVLPISYQASGSVIVSDQQPVAGISSEASIVKLGDPADLESHLLMAGSPRLLRQIMSWPEAIAQMRNECQAAEKQALLPRLLGRHSGPSCEDIKPDSVTALTWAQNRFSVGVVGRSRVIAVAYTSPLPEVATFMANTLINAYLADSRLQKLQPRISALEWLHQQLTSLNEAMSKDDRDIELYRREHGLIRGQFGPLSSERLTEFSQQVALAQAVEATAFAQLKNDNEDPSTSTPALTSRTVGDLKQALAKVSADIANRGAVAGANDPRMVSLVQQRNALQVQLDSETQRVTTGIRRTHDVAAAGVAALTPQLQSLKDTAGDANVAEAQMAGMAREAQRRRDLYSELSKKTNELETESRVLTGDAQLVNLAELPEKPTFPKRVPFAAAGVIVALVLAVAASLLRTLGDKSVRNVEVMQEMVGVRAVGVIPTVQTGLLRSRAVLGRALGDPASQAALRTLRSQLDRYARSLDNKQRRMVLMLTSSGKREGKTCVTLALASLAAEAGQKVLAIELTSSRPLFRASHIASSSRNGLKSFLEGEAEFEDVVIPSHIANLDVIMLDSSGPLADGALVAHRLQYLLRKASGYDLVLIDGPDAKAVANLSVLAQQVDGILYCARWGATSVVDIANGVGFLLGLGGRIIGVTLTLMPPALHRLHGWRPAPSTQLVTS